MADENKSKKEEKPAEATGYEGTGHEKDPLKTKPSTGYEGTGQEPPQ